MMVSSERRKTLFSLLGLGAGALWLLTNAGKSGTPRYNVPEVSLPQAKALFDAGALLVDVRSQAAFNARHLPGAVLFPLAVLRASIPFALAEAKARQVVVYCADGASSGPEATHLLVQAGFTHAANLRSGIEGWAGAGLPVTQA